MMANLTLQEVPHENRDQRREACRRLNGPACHLRQCTGGEVGVDKKQIFVKKKYHNKYRKTNSQCFLNI